MSAVCDTTVDADLVAEARSWLGVKWVHQGRGRDGVDCVGLPMLVARALRGYTLDMANYAAQALDETMLYLCDEHMDRVPLSQMRAGLVVVMPFANQRHMGILGDYQSAGLSLIHSSTYFGKVVEHRFDSVWRRRCIAAFALRDLRGGN